MLLLLALMLSADAPNLSTIKTASVEPVDALGDDIGVSQCFAEHLAKLTPIAVAPKEEADVVIRVSAHLPSTTTKVLVGVMGGSPSGHVYVETLEGKRLFDDGGKYRRSMMQQGQFGAAGADTAKSIECGVADDLLEHLREAMKKARDKK